MHQLYQNIWCTASLPIRILSYLVQPHCRNIWLHSLKHKVNAPSKYSVVNNLQWLDTLEPRRVHLNSEYSRTYTQRLHDCQERCVVRSAWIVQRRRLLLKDKKANINNRNCLEKYTVITCSCSNLSCL